MKPKSHTYLNGSKFISEDNQGRIDALFDWRTGEVGLPLKGLSGKASWPERIVLLAAFGILIVSEKISALILLKSEKKNE